MDSGKCRVLIRAGSVCLLLLCAAAMVRSLLVGLEIDEQYALSLSYRLLRGDTLLYTMWEPHQFSALPAAVLLALFIGVSGGTSGVLLFFRLVMLFFKLLLAVWAGRQLAGWLPRRTACLLALALLLYTPKWFLGPDYTSQQYHFTLAAFLLLAGHYLGPQAGKRVWPVAAGAVCACLSYLAFPQSIVAVLPLWLGLWRLGAHSGEPRLWGRVPRGAAVFLLTCVGCGAAFLLYLFRGLPPALLLPRLSLILNDPQYNFTTAERLALLGGQAVSVLRFWARPALLALATLLFWRPHSLGQGVERLLCAFSAWVLLFCLLYAVRDSALDMRQAMPVLTVLGGWVFWADRKRSEGRAVRMLLFWLGYLPGLAAYVFILRSSLIGLTTTFMYLTFPALCGVAALALRAGRAGAADVILLLFVLFLAVCRLYLVQTTGWRAHNILDTPLRQAVGGPAAGVWMDEPAADRQLALQRALAGAEAGAQLLLSTGDVQGLGFLMDDGTLRVGQASVISSTDGDTRFIDYYREFPQKRPDIIVYDRDDVRDNAAFHAWLETNLPIADREEVACGDVCLEVLRVADIPS